MKKLSLRNIYKIYDNGTKAVNNFNLEIGDNEFVVFVGPSGCGKSTTLRMIAGLEDITAGDFYLEGRLANQLEPKDRDMAMVFQNYALYPHMTVYDNMAFGLRLRKIPKNEIEMRVQNAAQILDIVDQLSKKPKEMSGGQRQRVALGRAIVRNPKVFLLDEPLSNLDAKLRSSMRTEIMRLYHQLNTTFIYVTHDQVEAMTMGTRIVVMSKGFIQQVDTPMNLFDYPINTFVAGFIGTPQMNLFQIGLVGKGSKIEVGIGENKISVNRSSLQKLNGRYFEINTTAILGIRPDHIKVYKEKTKNTLEAKITIIEKLGHEEILNCEVNGFEKSISVKTQRDDSLVEGDTVYLELLPGHIHLFSNVNEQTILPRIPTSSYITTNVKNGTIQLFDKVVSLPSIIVEKLNDNCKIGLDIDITAFIDGNDFKLPIINKELIGEKWVYTLEYKGEYVSLIKDEEINSTELAFSILFEKVDFYQNKEMVLAKLINKNQIKGKLTPVKKNMPVPNKANKFKNRRVFNYLIGGYQIDVPAERIEKIYAVLGKKFDLHDIEFYFDPENVQITDSGIPGKITNILEYGQNKFISIALNDGQIILAKVEQNYEMGADVFVQINVNDIGVYDMNFDVTLL